jgi:hypothetical protein
MGNRPSFRAAVWTATVAIVGLLSTTASHADCIVIPPRTSARDFPSDLIFAGTVKEVGADLSVSFEVDRVWNGRVQRHMRLWIWPGTEAWTSDSFKKGNTYLVFANASAERVTKWLVSPDPKHLPDASQVFYNVSFCSPTSRLDDAQGKSFVEELGPARSPLD